MDTFLAQAIDIWENTGSGGATCNVAGPCTFCDGLIVVSNILTLLFQIAIPIAVAVVVWGALKLMFAGGSAEKVSGAKKTMTSAIVGIIIVFAVVVILRTLFHILSGSPDFPWESITCQS
ncbi:MAG: hypothetical protein V2A55_02155 [Candidatus Jorgensenbacteria bacterium]